MLSKRIIALFIGGVMTAAPIASWGIEVFPVVKEVKEETPRDNYVTVKSNFRAKDSVTENKAAEQQYEFVTLELYRVKNPGADNEERVKELGAENPTLVFSPTKLVIPYGEERKVRIMPLHSIQHEQVYRMRIRPSYPEQAVENGKVRFAIGYDVLLRYLPSGKRTQDIALTCNGNQWTLSATGNVRSELRNMVIDGRKSEGQFNVYPEYARTLSVSNRLSFDIDGATRVYEQCQLKG